MSEEHDKGYRLLFSFQLLVEQLVRLFVGGDWVKRLDFSTLEKFSERRVSNNLQRREKDLIWRLRYRPRDGDGSRVEWFYVYLHFEFQSEPDRFMALRMVVYKVLLYEELVRRNEVPENGLLPPVLSLVLYNGRGPWREALSLADLVQPLPGIPGVELPAGLSLLSYELIDA